MSTVEAGILGVNAAFAAAVVLSAIALVLTINLVRINRRKAFAKEGAI